MATTALITETPEVYLTNAKETLKKAEKRDRFYTYPKYVKMASHAAYTGMLLALDPLMPPLKRGSRRDQKHYRAMMSKEGGPLKDFDNAYNSLHLYGGYDGTLSVATIQDGLKSANVVIAWAGKARRRKEIG